VRSSALIHVTINTPLTAENVDETPLPQLNAPPLTPQLPLEEVIVKLEAVPEIVKVASVCVDHVPRDKRPPTGDPERIALIVALAGKAPTVYKHHQNLPDVNTLRNLPQSDPTIVPSQMMNKDS